MPWGAEASKSRVTPKVLAGTAGLARFLVIPGGHIEQPHLASRTRCASITLQRRSLNPAQSRG